MMMESTLYLDIETAGSLQAALIHEMKLLFPDDSSQILESIHKGLQVNGSSRSHANYERNHRDASMRVEEDERQLVFNFWYRGAAMGRGETTSLSEAASILHAWLVDTSTISDISGRFPFFVAEEQAEAFERGEEVEMAWNRLRRQITEDTGRFAAMLPLADEVMQRPKLRQLFPFVSHGTLCFSRTTGYPYTLDCPSAAHVKDEIFGAFMLADRRFILLGEGNAVQVADLLISALPPNCGPAVPGTARDLR